MSEREQSRPQLLGLQAGWRKMTSVSRPYSFSYFCPCQSTKGPLHRKSLRKISSLKERSPLCNFCSASHLFHPWILPPFHSYGQ